MTGLPSLIVSKDAGYDFIWLLDVALNSEKRANWWGFKVIQTHVISSFEDIFTYDDLPEEFHACIYMSILLISDLADGVATSTQSMMFFTFLALEILQEERFLYQKGLIASSLNCLPDMSFVENTEDFCSSKPPLLKDPATTLAAPVGDRLCLDSS